MNFIIHMTKGRVRERHEERRRKDFVVKRMYVIFDFLYFKLPFVKLYQTSDASKEREGWYMYKSKVLMDTWMNVQGGYLVSW